MVALSDVAERAGVSPATVSRYLAGQRVRSAESIRGAIEELDYAPSRTARALRSGVTFVVAVIVPDITNPFFASVVKGVESMCRKTPYTISLYNSDEDLQQERAVVEAVANQVDGVILAPTTEEDRSPELLRDAGIPVVFIDRTLLEAEEFDSVLVDNAGGAAAAARHFVELGHRRVATIAGPVNTTPGRLRLSGFVQELERGGFTLPEQYRRIADFRQAGGYREMLSLLALSSPPTAVFCANNSMTIGALKALNDMSVSIPDEMAVIGFDDLDFAQLLTPALTVIQRDAVEQGALAMRLLLKRLEGVRDRPRSIALDARLVVRGSCAPWPPPAGANPGPAAAQRRAKEGNSDDESGTATDRRRGRG